MVGQVLSINLILSWELNLSQKEITLS